MDSAQLAASVRRVLQVTVAGKIYAALAAAVASPLRRTVAAVGAALLLAGGRASLARAPPSATVAADLALAVASTALLQAVAVDGARATPLQLAHYCMVLEAGQVLAPATLGHLGDAFLGNVQFFFADAVAGLLLSVHPVSTAYVVAVAFAGFASLGGGELLVSGLASASLTVLRTLLLEGMPAALTLPTLLVVLSFARPIHTLLGLADPVYDFALYQVGLALQAALEAHLPLLTATLASLALICVAPTPAIRAAAEIAAMGAVIDLIMGLMQQAAETDPVLCLLPVLVFARVLTAYLA
jgi:hypothetical protein